MTDKENVLCAFWDSSFPVRSLWTPHALSVEKTPIPEAPLTHSDFHLCLFSTQLRPQKLVVPRDVMLFTPASHTAGKWSGLWFLQEKGAISEARTLCLEFPGEGMSPKSGRVLAVRLPKSPVCIPKDLSLPTTPRGIACLPSPVHP